MVKTAIIGLVCASLLITAPSWAANMESPAHGANLSGIGFISGWKCDAGDITVTINGGGHIPVAIGMPRADTRVACGTLDNGFITQINWNFLGTGKHTVVAYDDGVEFASSVFTVATTGAEFLPDAAGECVVPDFPAPGENASFAWNTSTQHLELTDVGPHVPAPGVEHHAFDGRWRFTLTYAGRCTVRPQANYWMLLVQSSYVFFGDSANATFLVREINNLGAIEGHITDLDNAQLLHFSGILSGNSGEGTWFNQSTCVGQWTAERTGL